MRISTVSVLPPKKPESTPTVPPISDRHERRDEADDQRDAAARDQQGEHVDAAVVGPEPVRAARRLEDGADLRGRVVRLEERSEDRDEDEEREDREPDHRLPVAAGSPCGRSRGRLLCAIPSASASSSAACSGSIRLMPSPAGRT